MAEQSLRKKRAAALKYDPEKNGAPVVVASGMGYTAEKITETAMRAGVPIYEDDSLSTLLTKLKLGTEIPPELFQAVVEIYVYFLHFADKDKQNAGTSAAGGGAAADAAGQATGANGVSEAATGGNGVSGVTLGGNGQPANGGVANPQAGSDLVNQILNGINQPGR
jgi:flagellar biosynthesis protein